MGGIVGLAASQSDDPTIRRRLQERRLKAIARKPDREISRLEAEDGLVLSRRLEERKLAERFARLVASRRGSPRPGIHP